MTSYGLSKDFRRGLALTLADLNTHAINVRGPSLAQQAEEQQVQIALILQCPKERAAAFLRKIRYSLLRGFALRGDITYDVATDELVYRSGTTESLITMLQERGIEFDNIYIHQLDTTMDTLDNLESIKQRYAKYELFDEAVRPKKLQPRNRFELPPLDPKAPPRNHR